MRVAFQDRHVPMGAWDSTPNYDIILKGSILSNAKLHAQKFSWSLATARWASKSIHILQL